MTRIVGNADTLATLSKLVSAILAKGVILFRITRSVLYSAMVASVQIQMRIHPTVTDAECNVHLGQMER
jgi:hypothetical protein